jgi:ABC-type transport system involved in multi-copper enzyme maturation permease subunit
VTAHVSPAPASAQGPKPGFFARLFRDPNAIWMREMRQSARLGRTPWILFGLALTISLLMCSIGGIAATDNASPATLGGALFQTFFSIAAFVVMLIGPTVAANSIASEREGRTWEAVQLTGLHPKDIARGKFLAAYSTIATYIVVLAPVGALPFLFGGVTPVEVIVAFAFLFLLAALAVAFGLAVSSLMSSLRAAIVVTLILAIVIGPSLYGLFGFSASFGAHKLWPELPEGFPIWLPLAYTRASFGLEYVALLVVVPLVLVLLPAWFLYEVTVANLTGETDDRSTGLKRWFFVSTPLLALACAIPSAVAFTDEDRVGYSIAGQTTFIVYAGFAALLFAFEPAGPSRRVLVHWRRENAGILRRFFGPGLPKTATLVVLLGFLGLASIAALDLIALNFAPTTVPPAYSVYGYAPPITPRADMMAQIALFAIYSGPYFIFTVGLTSYIRSRGSTPWISRLIASAFLFLIAAAPWVVAAIGGVVSTTHDDTWLIVGAPSPFFAYLMVGWVTKSSSSDVPIIQAGVACALLWGMVGLVLLLAAGRRASKAMREQSALVAQQEAALEAEEKAQAEAAARLAVDAAATQAAQEQAASADAPPAPATEPLTASALDASASSTVVEPAPATQKLGTVPPPAGDGSDKPA